MYRLSVYLLACSVFLMAVLSANAAFTESQYQDSFISWMQSHDVKYNTKEFNQRYSIYKKNMDFVHQWNAKGSATVLGMNAFADLTNEEYQRIYLGTKVDASGFLNRAAARAFDRNFNSHSLAATIDWRTKGAVTPVKNQQQCGSCWSFSTTGSTEGAHQISTGNLVALSEQNLIDCSTAEGNQGCNGGFMPDAFEYIIKNGGIDTEASYPYTATGPNTCRYNPKNSGATLSSYINVTSGSETALASAANINPVSVAIDASHNSFQLYTSGIYYEPACSSTALDHGVLVVGYGSGSAPATSSSSSSVSSGSGSGSSGSSSSGSSSGSGLAEFVEASNQNYWIVKNSWGPSWGLQGYILMSKDRNNNCGIATSASYPVV